MPDDKIDTVEEAETALKVRVLTNPALPYAIVAALVLVIGGAGAWASGYFADHTPTTTVNVTSAVPAPDVPPPVVATPPVSDAPPVDTDGATN